VNTVNRKITLVEPQENLVLNGHNNLILVKTQINNVVVAGHNNRIYYQGSRSQTPAIFGKIVVQGHNNTIDNVIVHTLTVSGHNNTTQNVYYAGCSNQGIQNKFSNCKQLSDNSVVRFFGQMDRMESEPQEDVFGSDEEGEDSFDSEDMEYGMQDDHTSPNTHGQPFVGMN